MADVDINKFRASVVRDGSKPASPGFVVSEGQDPVNPPGTNNYVPYSGATANVELGEFGVEAGFITLDTTPTNTPTDQGTIFWDADDETVDIVLNGYTMKIGEDLFYPVKNQTGSTIAKGVAVRFNGTLGASGRLLIAPFIADGSVPSSRFMGVTAEEILNGEDGKVLYFGRIRGINTNAFNEGDILYASTTVAGGYQTAIPVAPNNIVQVAAVVTKHVNNGTIFVRPTLGSNLNTDEAVKLTSVADKNLLQYQSGTALWENKTLAQVLGGTSSQFVKGDGSLDSSTYGTGTVNSVGLSSATSGVTIGSTPVTTSGTITLAIATASGSQNGLLSSTDWTTFNNKQNALTNPVTGTGTTNYLPKFTGASTIGNSQVFDDGTGVGIGTALPADILDVQKNQNAVTQIYFRNTDTTNTSTRLYSNFTAGNRTFGIATIHNDHNYIFGVSGANLYFQQTFGGTTNMLITSSGNLLVGTTTDNGARLQVSGFGTISNGLQISGGPAGYGGAELVLNSVSDGFNAIYTNGGGAVGMFFDHRGTSNSGYWVFRNGTGAGSERLRITSSGNVGIGTLTPQVRLHIYDATAVRFDMQDNTNTWATLIDNATGQYRIRYASGAINPVCITTGGEVLIGNTDNGAYNLQCNGTGVWGQGAYVNGSDRNIKDNIATIEKGLEYIQKMNPVKFRYKPNYTRDHSMQTGFIAQELQEVFASEDYVKGLVQQGVHLSVAYQNLLPILVKAIQELKQEIDTLKN